MAKQVYQILPGYFSQEIDIPSLSLSETARPQPKSGEEREKDQTLVVHQVFPTVEQVPARFGLIDEAPDRWPRLRQLISGLNVTAGKGSHKLLLLVRHGEGYHNVAEAKYGTKAWDDHWSKLNGDDELTWGPDPQLTPRGVGQAKFSRSVWEEELLYGLQRPDKIYCSPHSRALKTCEIVFEGYFDDGLVTVIEASDCREENGVHTCDKRGTRSFIAHNYPNFQIEESLTEEDELWSPDVRETKAEVAARALKVINRLWKSHPDEEFIAITAHSGFINGVLVALGSRPYPLPTGGVLPLIIRQVKG